MKTISLHDRLESIFKYLNVNQKEFALLSGLTENTLSNARKGKNKPCLKFFNSIHRIIPNINPLWLYLGEGEMFASLNGKHHNGKNHHKLDIGSHRIIIKNENDPTDPIEDCCDKLKELEKEINYLKKQLADKLEIIRLLKDKYKD